MDKCQWCCKDSIGYGMVSLALNKDEIPKLICGDCFNTYMANTLEIEDDRNFEEEVNFNDCDGVKHSFQIVKRIHPTGICWEAVELLEGDTKTIQAKAARLGFSLVSNHPFVDGNKRIGILAMMVFLEMNGLNFLYR